MCKRADYAIYSVISSAIVVLLRELEASCDPHFSTLTRSLWANVKNVSSQSTYMTELVPGISTVADLAREVVEKKKYLRNFYDKAARCVRIIGSPTSRIRR